MLNKLIRLLKDSSLYTISAVAARFIGIILIPIYTRVFSPEQYGIIDLITTVTTLIIILLVAGLDSAIARYFIDADSETDKKIVASTGIFYLSFISFAVVIILLPFTRELSYLVLGSPDYHQFMSAGLLVVPFTVLSSAFTNLLRFKLKARNAAFMSIGILITLTGLTVLFVVVLHQGLLGIYIAAIITLFLFSIAGYWLTRDSISCIFSLRKLKKLFAFGIPYLPLSFAFYIMSYSSRYFLVNYGGLDEVGLYGIGYRLASIISIITGGFELAWGPFIMSTYRETNAKYTFARVFDYASVIICLGILLLSLFSREILYMFTTTTYLNAYKVVPLLATSIVAYTLGAYFAIGIGITKRTIHMAWAGILTAVLNLILNYFLIPAFGAIGAAVASTLSFIILGVILMVVSQKLYKMPYRFMPNFLLYIIMAVIIFFAYSYLLDKITLLNIVLKGILIAVFLTVPFILKLIGLSELKYLQSIVLNIFKKS